MNNSISKMSCKYFSFYWVVDNKGFTTSWIVIAAFYIFVKLNEVRFVLYLKFNRLFAVTLIFSAFKIGFK